MDERLFAQKLPESLAYRPLFVWNAPLSAAQGHVVSGEGRVFLAAPLCEEVLRYSRELELPRSLDPSKLGSYADMVASNLIGVYRSAAIHHGQIQNPRRSARQDELQREMYFACKVSQHQRECRLYAQLPLAEKFKVNAARRLARLEEDFNDAMQGGAGYYALQSPQRSGFAEHFVENVPLTEAGLTFVRATNQMMIAMQDPVRKGRFEYDFLGLACPQGETGPLQGGPEQLGLYRYTAHLSGLCAA